MRDLRLTLRGLARRPVFTVVVILTLALGIGATTAIFTIVEAVVLRPLPYREPNRLVHIFENYPKGSRYESGSDRTFIGVRAGTYHDWNYAVAQRQREMGIRLALGAAPSRVGGLVVSEA